MSREYKTPSLDRARQTTVWLGKCEQCGVDLPALRFVSPSDQPAPSDLVLLYRCCHCAGGWVPLPVNVTFSASAD